MLGRLNLLPADVNAGIIRSLAFKITFDVDVGTEFWRTFRISDFDRLEVLDASLLSLK